MLTRKEILSKAVHDCYAEMYAKAQPSADYDTICEDLKNGKIDEKKDGPVYERHYLSQEEYDYIVDKYMDAYRIKCEWPDDVQVVEDYLIDGGYEMVYKDTKYDENGNVIEYGSKHYEKDKSLKELFCDYFKKTLGTDENSMPEGLYKIVIDKIRKCKHYYKFNVEENSFRFTMALGHAPTPNKETVKNWWKKHHNQDIEIKDRNPDLLWDMDEYGEEFEEIMKDEYGDNWEQITWDNYHEKHKKLEDET